MPSRRVAALLSAALLSAALCGCQPSVGDVCQSNVECGATEGAICDVSVPQGYCTVAGCVPNGCPEDSVCVRFDEQTSYCMQICLSDGECREEHTCRDVGTYAEEGFGYCYVAP